MKFDICSRRIDYVCDNPKYCCESFKCVIETNIFDVDTLGKVTVRNKYDYYGYDYDRKSSLNWDTLQLNYCPFCGEKIE